MVFNNDEMILVQHFILFKVYSKTLSLFWIISYVPHLLSSFLILSLSPLLILYISSISPQIDLLWLLKLACSFHPKLIFSDPWNWVVLFSNFIHHLTCSASFLFFIFPNSKNHSSSFIFSGKSSLELLLWTLITLVISVGRCFHLLVRSFSVTSVRNPIQAVLTRGRRSFVGRSQNREIKNLDVGWT